MLDINLIREKPDVVRKALADRQMDSASVDAILALDEKRRALLSKVETLKAERNTTSKEIGQMKEATARQSKIEAMRVVGDQIAELDKQVAEVGYLAAPGCETDDLLPRERRQGQHAERRRHPCA